MRSLGSTLLQNLKNKLLSLQCCLMSTSKQWEHLQRQKSIRSINGNTTKCTMAPQIPHKQGEKLEPCILSSIMSCINGHEIHAKCQKAVPLKLSLDAHHKGFFRKSRSHWRRVYYVLQDTVVTALLELEEPQLTWDHIIVIKADLEVLHDPLLVIDIMCGDIIITICPLAGLLYAF